MKCGAQVLFLNAAEAMAMADCSPAALCERLAKSVELVAPWQLFKALKAGLLGLVRC